LNEAAEVAYDRETADVDFGPYQPYTMDERIVIGDELHHCDCIGSMTDSLDDVSDELVRNNLFLYTFLRLGVDQKRGGVVDDGHGSFFRIAVTKYELGGMELMYTINTIYQACMNVCMAEDHALAALRYVDGVDSIQVVGEDGDGGVFLNRDGEHDSDSESMEEEYLEDYDSSWFGWTVDHEEGDERALENFVMDLSLTQRHDQHFVPPELPLVYYIMGQWYLWVEVAAVRMKISHAVRVIQRRVRAWLYEPGLGVFVKRGKLRFESSVAERMCGPSAAGPRKSEAGEAC
jgi:hypothetical protein